MEEKKSTFHRAYLRYGKRLHHHALKLCKGDEDRASDLVQETLLRAYQSWERFDQRHTIRWLLRIQKNIFINHYHQQRRHHEALSLYQAEERHLAPNQDQRALAAREETRLDRAYLSEVLGAEMMAALDTLDPPQRSVVLLAWLYDLKSRDIAELTARPLGTVLSWLSRAREKLRAQLSRRKQARLEGRE